MTREEIRIQTIAQLERISGMLGSMGEEKDWTEYAIRALEQEPILDKIRAEIENDWQLKKYPSSPFACGLRRALEIINKYKADKEQKK